MGYTPEQEQCILRLHGPVDVSAGAGSGKTFTLTQRIAHALADPESGVDDIDQVLAITFTKKAAAELKGRVRSTLRAQGMFDQARKVDGAWISTIHSMCARLLRASALEIGIDPGFTVMEDSSSVLDQAMEEILEESRESAYQAYRQLFRAYPITSGGVMGESVTHLLGVLLEEAHALPHGFDDMLFIASHEDASELVRCLITIYEDSLAVLGQIKESTTRQNNISLCEKALEALGALLTQQGKESAAHDAIGAFGLSSAVDALDTFDASAAADASVTRTASSGQLQEALLDALPLCGRLDGRCGTKEQKEQLKGLQAAYDDIVMRIVLCQNNEIFQQLIALARSVENRFAAKKHGLGVLDNGDLIRQALYALENVQVKALYAHKFRLVMVDEFQDTDALQLAIVKVLSGEGQRYLCTVGDAQQSIYRFRGADVALYRAYQREMFEESAASTGGDPCALRLTRNFRSHADILAFVKAVCAQPQVFGQDFLDLQAVYDGSGYCASLPRIAVDVTLRHKGKAEEVGSKDAALQEQAARIVSFFARMKDAGHDLSDMVLLLGATTHASLYAQTLRQAGFDCVISGGSLFAQSDEAQHMVHLARALVNFKDTEALANALMGPLFMLSANDMLTLGTTWDASAQTFVKSTLDKGLARAFAERAHAEARQGDYAQKLRSPRSVSLTSPNACESLLEIGEGASLEGEAKAAQLLYAARDSLRWQPLSRALLWLLRQSGCFARLETQGAQGSACIGNYMKALRLMEAAEAEGGVGPAQVAQRYEQAINAGMKEAPGALNVHDQQAIRIMTIHASKGLEFPIVAMADFAKTPRSNGLLVARFAGKTYATLFPKGVKIGSKTYGRSMEMQLVDEEEEASETLFAGEDVMKAQVVLQRCADADEAAEGQRLFYVGATRAKEALGLFITAQEKTDPTAVYTGAEADIAHALFADGAISEGVSHAEYGGSEPAMVDCHYYEMPGEAPGAMPEEASGFDDDAPEASLETFLQGLSDNVISGDSEESSLGSGSAQVPSAHASEPCAVPFEPLAPLPAQKDVSNPNADIVSYTSLSDARLTHGELDQLLAVADDDEAVLPVAASVRLSADEDKATNFGLALHRACQLCVETSAQNARNHLGSLVKTYGISNEKRLEAAYERWVKSAAYARASEATHRFAEHPFALRLDDTACVLEGAFDLLCVEDESNDAPANCENAAREDACLWAAGKTAYIVDYKTGGKAQESAQELHEKHGLQAVCYAFAALKAGFAAVDIDFVRVEQDDPSGNDAAQTVAFRFNQGDIDQLQAILERRVEALGADVAQAQS